MTTIQALLETYYLRREPLGLAYVTHGSPAFTYGRPCTFMLAMLASTDGLQEFHLERWQASVFVSSFGRERFLIAQFPLGVGEATVGAPSSFVRLASAIQKEIENPNSSSEPPGENAVRVPRPDSPRPKSSVAQAPLDLDEK